MAQTRNPDQVVQQQVGQPGQAEPAPSEAEEQAFERSPIAASGSIARPGSTHSQPESGPVTAAEMQQMRGDETAAAAAPGMTDEAWSRAEQAWFDEHVAVAGSPVADAADHLRPMMAHLRDLVRREAQQ